MAEIRFTRKAVEDLSDIWNYTADMWSERQADTYYRLLIASCRKLAGNPVLFGREYKELGTDIYGFKVNNHIVFYRIAGDKGIEVGRPSCRRRSRPACCGGGSGICTGRGRWSSRRIPLQFFE